MNKLDQKTPSSDLNQMDLESKAKYIYVDTKIDEDLMCLLCLEPFISAVSCPECGHSYCLRCITDWKSKESRCPNCQVSSDQRFIPSRAVNNLCDKLSVRCNSMKEGCEWTGVRDKLQSHVLQCDFQAWECPHANIGCQKKLMRRDRNHAESCEWRLLTCKCQAKIRARDREIHEQKECPIRSLEGMWLSVQDLQRKFQLHHRIITAYEEAMPALKPIRERIEKEENLKYEEEERQRKKEEEQKAKQSLRVDLRRSGNASSAVFDYPRGYQIKNLTDGLKLQAVHQELSQMGGMASVFRNGILLAQGSDPIQSEIGGMWYKSLFSPPVGLLANDVVLWMKPYFTSNFFYIQGDNNFRKLQYFEAKSVYEAKGSDNTYSLSMQFDCCVD